MARFGETISAILSKLAQLLGITPSDRRRNELLDQKLATAKASNIDRLEVLKDKIKQFEAQALRKKGEYEAARGDTKRIVGGEIERLFRDLDRLHSQEKVIASNIERISVAQAKLEEFKAAQTKGLEEGELDDIALQLQEVFDELKVADRAARDLERVEYEAPKSTPVNAEQRMAEVSGEQETTSGLSAETEKRLKRLEFEDA
ncbi:MAG: hypothetical protein KDA55_12235 [Planctomycetales bacterium]|nr:hypothetical protein [Planctomycetales bacterium]